MNVTMLQRRTLNETVTALVSPAGTVLWACSEPGLEGARGVIAAVGEARERRWTIVNEQGRRLEVRRRAA